jgi:hypothetical protein
VDGVNVLNIDGIAGRVTTTGSATISGDLTVDTSTLKVDSTNDRVGLGIAAPAYRLHVQGTASLQLVLQSNDTNANAKEGTVNIRHYTNAEEPVSAVGGFTTSSANEVYLGGGFSAGNAATLLGFYTAANNTTTVGTERYRIGSDGTSTWSVGGSTAMTLNSTGLGVGTSPSFTLDIAGASPRIRQVATTGTNSSLIMLVNTGGTAYLGLDTSTAGLGTAAYALNVYHGGAYPIVFSTSATERMRIDSTGNVGIGVGTFGTSAAKVLGLANATAPSTSPAGMGQLYVEAGALKYRGSSGTITTIANA